MGAFRDKPALAVGLLIVALMGLVISLYWTLIRPNQLPAVPNDSATTNPLPTPPPPTEGATGQTVPY